MADNWTQIADPTPGEYREHVADAWWISAAETELIEQFHTLENATPAFYRFDVTAPDSGKCYPTLLEAIRG